MEIYLIDVYRRVLRHSEHSKLEQLRRVIEKCQKLREDIGLTHPRLDKWKQEWADEYAKYHPTHNTLEIVALSSDGAMPDVRELYGYFERKYGFPVFNRGSC